MATFQSSESAETPSHDTRQDASSTLKAASAAVQPGKTSIGQKFAIAGTALRLARRYPVAAVIIGGIALAVYMSRSHSRPYASRY